MSTDVVTAPSRDAAQPEPAGTRAPISRRTVLGVLGGAAALAACEQVPISVPDVIAPPGPGTVPPPPGGGGPTPPAAPANPVTPGPITTSLTGDAATHLARRATFGPTPEVVAAIRADYAGWIAQQLAPTRDDAGNVVEDDVLSAALRRFPNLGRTSDQIYDNRDNNGAENGGTRADRDTVSAIIYRNAFSQWQLFEKLCEFWTNHFALDHDSDDDRGRATVFQREVIRKGALGSFADLLFAVLTDPAMMRFLDGDDNDKGSNENMAREIMELHTLGAGRGYTEDDIRELAKLISGLRYSGDDNVFFYDPDRHFVGPVTVRGVTYANDSADEAAVLGTDEAPGVMRQFTDSLAADPLTAEYLSQKLVQTFVADAPPASLVASLATAFQTSGGDIATWVTALFTSAEFASAVGQKVARPLDDLVGAIRVLGFTPQADPENGDRLRNAAGRLQQRPGEWDGPDGYPITAATWLSSGDLLNRWNLHKDLVDGDFDDALSPAEEAVDALVNVDLPAATGAVVDAVAQRLVFQDLGDAHRAAVLTYLGRTAEDEVADTDELRDVVKKTAVILLDTYCIQR